MATELDRLTKLGVPSTHVELSRAFCALAVKTHTWCAVFSADSFIKVRSASDSSAVCGTDARTGEGFESKSVRSLSGDHDHAINNTPERLKAQRVQIENGVEIEILDARVEIEIPNAATRRKPVTCRAHCKGSTAVVPSFVGSDHTSLASVRKRGAASQGVPAASFGEPEVDLWSLSGDHNHYGRSVAILAQGQ